MAIWRRAALPAAFVADAVGGSSATRRFLDAGAGGGQPLRLESVPGLKRRRPDGQDLLGRLLSEVRR